MKYLKYFLLLIVVLVLFFIGKGLFTPSVSYECEVTVNKPANEAWAVMSDESNLPKWINGFKRIELVSGEKNAVGAVSNVYVEDEGEEIMMTETITAIMPGEQMVMTFSMDFMNMDYEMLFEETDGKTKITTKSTTTGNGMMAKSMISFMPDAMRTQEKENLQSLKRIIEENTKNYFPESESVTDTSQVAEDSSQVIVAGE